MKNALRWTALVILAPLVTACGGGAGTGSQPPQITVNAPSDDVTLAAGERVAVLYVASDADDAALTELVAIADGREHPLASGLPETGASGSRFDWDTTGMVPGTYRIEARTTGGGETVVAEAPGRVTIERTSLAGPVLSWLGGDDQETLSAVDVFPDGSFCAAGSYRGEMTLSIGEASSQSLPSPRDTTAWAARYEADGHLRWALGAATSGEGSWATAIAALERDGSCVIAGVFHDSLTLDPGGPSETAVASGLGLSSSGFLARVSAEGSVLWAAPFFGLDENGVETDVLVTSIASLADDSILVTGAFAGDLHYAVPGGAVQTHTVDGDGMFVARIDGNGEPIWWMLGTSDDGLPTPLGLDAFPDGSCVVTGSFVRELRLHPGTIGESQIDFADDERKMFLVRLDRSGNRVWARVEGGFLTRASGHSVAAFADGSFGAVGIAHGSMTLGLGQPNVTVLPSDESQYFLARFDSDGTFRWAHTVPHTISYDRLVPDRVAAIEPGSLAYVCGVADSHLFDGAVGPVDVNPERRIQTMVLRFDEAGLLESHDADGYGVPGAGDPGGSFGNTIEVLAGDDVLVGGIMFEDRTAFEVDLGPEVEVLESIDDEDAFIQRMRVSD